MSDERLLADQLAYYRARAPEYDQWWRREGRYAKGDAFEREWRGEVAEVAAWLSTLSPSGDVLEVAAGTGNWTLELARHADRVTAVDASAETLDINRKKMAALQQSAPDVLRAEVDYIVADVFDWEPPRRFDHVFFSFWLSHVPDARIPQFFQLVERALAAGGTVVVVDNKAPEARRPITVSEATVVEAAGHGSDAADRPEGLSVRELNDGRTFTIVKVYRSPDRIAELLGPLGWTVEGRDTDQFFTYAALRRSA